MIEHTKQMVEIQYTKEKGYPSDAQVSCPQFNTHSYTGAAT